MTKLDPLSQLSGASAGEPRVFVQLENGSLAFVLLDPATLEIVPGTPPILRALPSGGEAYSDLREGHVVDTPEQVFTLAQVPAPATDILVFRNGLLMLDGPDYAYAVGVVTFTEGQPIKTGDTVQFKYKIAN